MKQIKNNYKFSNDKNYNIEFLDKLENKEEFDCTVHTGLCLMVSCRVNIEGDEPVPNGPMPEMPDNFWTRLFREIFGHDLFERNGNNAGNNGGH